MTVSTLDRLRAASTDRTRLAPVSRTAGTEVVEVEPGRVRARLPSAAVFPGPGAMLVLADFVLGAAIGTTLPPGGRVSTLSLHASLLAPARAGELVATGTLTHRDGGTGASRAEVSDGAGDLVALLTCRCAVVPASGAPAGTEWAAAALDLRPAGDGVAAVAEPGLANFGSTVQGGVLATVLAHALDATGGGVELDVTFLRPVATDGQLFTALATPLHDGARFAAGHAELRDAGGRLAAVATASRWRAQLVGGPVTKQNSLPSGSPST